MVSKALPTSKKDTSVFGGGGGGGGIYARYQNLKHSFQAKKAPLFFPVKNISSFITTLTLDEQEHAF